MVRNLSGRTPFVAFTLSSCGAVAGGLSFLLGFPATGFWPLVLVGLILLFWSLNMRGLWLTVWSSFLFGSTFFIPHIYWAKISVGSYGPWLALALIQVFFIVFWSLLFRLTCQLNPLWLRALVIGLSWAGIEQLRGHVPYGGFPWAYVAYSQVDSFLGLLAPVGGEVLVSSVTVIIAFFIYVALFEGFLKAKVRLVYATLALALFCFPFFAISLPLDTGGETLRVVAVQGNLESVHDFADPTLVTRNHVRETEVALAKVGDDNVDLVVWGENALSRDPRQDSQNMALVEQLVSQHPHPYLMGAVRYEDNHRFNDYLVVDSDGAFPAAYTKQVPVPFGEYIPNRAFFAKITSDVDQISTDMLPGDKPAVLPVNIKALGREVKVGTGICFEVAIDSVIADAVRSGAEILIIPTNNATFGFSAESDQQLQMVRFRALEYQRAAVQVSTQGKSGMVLPDGTLLDYTQLFKADYLSADLPLSQRLTWATYSAPYLVWASWAVVALQTLAAVIYLFRRPKKARKTSSKKRR